MRIRKTVVALGLAGVVAGAAIAGTAFAQTPTPPVDQAKTNYQNVYMDKLAAALGTTRDKLNAAFTQARNDTADQEVKDGKLTQQQADKIKSSQGDAPFGFGFKGGDRERGQAGFFMGNDVRDAIAKALGMSTQDMNTQLRSGKTLADLAKGKEQAVKDAIVNTVKPKLDQQVKDGKLTQDRENQIIDGIQKSDLSKMGGKPEMGQHRAPRNDGGNESQTPKS
jgi:hypothetical protein